MNIMKGVSLVVFIAALTSCASINKPSPTLIETLPIVTIGKADDAPKEHILFIPSNKEFPVTFLLNGTVLNDNKSSTIMISFRRDIYLYKYWASYDGKAWANSHELLSVNPSGGFDASGGKVEVRIDYPSIINNI